MRKQISVSEWAKWEPSNQTINQTPGCCVCVCVCVGTLDEDENGSSRGPRKSPKGTAAANTHLYITPGGKRERSCYFPHTPRSLFVGILPRLPPHQIRFLRVLQYFDSPKDWRRRRFKPLKCRPSFNRWMDFLDSLEQLDRFVMTMTE